MYDQSELHQFAQCADPLTVDKWLWIVYLNDGPLTTCSHFKHTRRFCCVPAAVALTFVFLIVVAYSTVFSVGT